ncbi:hypothetical protein GDO86_018835 [Hymenochirus boettgeri]|uniref:Peptidase S1 domain-containing protein n=1 Tax=Hymenochirus boettgeri TaxID=247094 RepID=A0A8T2IPL3_9PIPI|nr:hypothetical protein GDO86_018835 [Hymenochirus boettgeri]
MRSRIYGGTNALEGEWPWYAILIYQGKPFCGGSLISNNYIITAAHCFDGDSETKNPGSWSVQLGSTRVGEPLESSTLTLGASRILTHEDYFHFLEGNDLALVKLSKPVKFSNIISPVCLPEKGHRFGLRKTCWSLGLQERADGEPLNSNRTLKKVAQTLIGPKTCNCIYNSHGNPELSNPAFPSMLCAAETDGEKGPCLGDSGGPVVCNEDGVWFLAGVISFAHGCHLLDSPTIITAVSRYQQWIDQKAGGDVAFSVQTINVTDDVDTDNCSDLLSTKHAACGIVEMKDTEPKSPGAWPWQVDVQMDGRRICGGALISANWVVTAAHCFTDTFSSDSPSDWSVVWLLEPRHEGNSSTKDQPSWGLRFHRGRQRLSSLQLIFPASFGWNRSHPDGKVAPPQGVQMDLIGPNKCNCIYSNPSSVNQSVSVLPGMLCASHHNGEPDHCFIDSGGPLVCNENGTWFLVGLHSFGGDCQGKNNEGKALPGVYTKLSDFEDWISKVTRDAYFHLQIGAPDKELDSESCSVEKPRACGHSVASPGPAPIGDAPDASWPWQVSIQQYGTHACSGVLVAETWVLTAAQCVSSFVLTSDYKVHLGKQSQGGHNPHQVIRKVKRVVTHPKYVKASADNDLALVEIYYGVTYSDYIQPICLPCDLSQPPAMECWVAGWQKPQALEDVSPSVLREIKVSLLNLEKCGVLRNKTGPNTETQLCAKGYGRNFTCLDDSSAPLMCQINHEGPWFVLGISSYGTKSTQSVCPRNFTAVSSKVSWIQEVIQMKGAETWCSRNLTSTGGHVNTFSQPYGDHITRISGGLGGSMRTTTDRLQIHDSHVRWKEEWVKSVRGDTQCEQNKFCIEGNTHTSE